MMARERDAFQSLYPQASIEIEDGSSRDAIGRLFAGTADLAVITRELAPEERAAALRGRLELEGYRFAQGRVAGDRPPIESGGKSHRRGRAEHLSGTRGALVAIRRRRSSDRAGGAAPGVGRDPVLRAAGDVERRDRGALGRGAAPTRTWSPRSPRDPAPSASSRSARRGRRPGAAARRAARPAVPRRRSRARLSRGVPAHALLQSATFARRADRSRTGSSPTSPASTGSMWCSSPATCRPPCRCVSFVAPH